MDEPEDFAGGTTRTAFPHKCPFNAIGTRRDMCRKFSSDARYNVHCQLTKCNSEMRVCYKCAHLTDVSKMHAVLDPEEGLCGMHRAEAKAQRAAMLSKSRDTSPAQNKSLKRARDWKSAPVASDEIVQRALRLVPTLPTAQMRVFVAFAHHEESVAVGRALKIEEGTVNVHASGIYKHLGFGSVPYRSKRSTLMRVIHLYLAREREILAKKAGS
jgi:hypothetical protein